MTDDASADVRTRDRAIVFVTDVPFLIPTLQTALQAIEQPGVSQLADVLIYLTFSDEALVAQLRSAFATFPLQFHLMTLEQFSLPTGTFFNKTHVPLTTLARLSLDQLLPSQYEHILYLDGDIQIVGDILPLLKYDVPNGRIAAGTEAAWIYQGEFGRYWRFVRSYLNGLGISEPSDYFNAGVLAFRRQTWLDYAPRAKEFFVKNAHLCVYHDQSALNAVFLGRRDVLAPRWNFVAGYASNSPIDIGALKIIHFTGAEKPWVFTGAPWNGQFAETYQGFVHRFAVLAPLASNYIAVMDRGKAEKRTAEMKKSIRSPPPWRYYLRSQRIKRYIAKTHFALP